MSFFMLRYLQQCFNGSLLQGPLTCIITILICSHIYSPYFPQICPMVFTSESTTSAKEHFGQSLALLPSARAHFGRGTCLAALRRREEALEELSEAVAMCPTMVGAIINLAGLVGLTRGEGLPSQQCQPRINKPLGCLIGGYHFSSHLVLFGSIWGNHHS